MYWEKFNFCYDDNRKYKHLLKGYGTPITQYHNTYDYIIECKLLVCSLFGQNLGFHFFIGH